MDFAHLPLCRYFRIVPLHRYKLPDSDPGKLDLRMNTANVPLQARHPSQGKLGLADQLPNVPRHRYSPLPASSRLRARDFRTGESTAKCAATPLQPAGANREARPFR